MIRAIEMICLRPWIGMLRHRHHFSHSLRFEGIQKLSDQGEVLHAALYWEVVFLIDFCQNYVSSKTKNTAFGPDKFFLESNGSSVALKHLLF